MLTLRMCVYVCVCNNHFSLIYCYPNPSLNYCNSLHLGFPVFRPLHSKVFSPLSRLNVPFKICHLKHFFAYTCSSFPFCSVKASIPKMTSINLQDLALATLPLHFVSYHLPSHSLRHSQIDLLAFPCRHQVCSHLRILLLFFSLHETILFLTSAWLTSS